MHASTFLRGNGPIYADRMLMRCSFVASLDDFQLSKSGGMSIATDCCSASTAHKEEQPLESTQGRCGQHPPSGGTSEDRRLKMSM